MKTCESKPLAALDAFPSMPPAPKLPPLGAKIVVLDDDPTGTQTVHDVFVYTDWTEETIRRGFEDENDLFFILTNSRSFSAEKTAAVHAEIARRVCRVSAALGRPFVLISRGDSTLRGHWPLETLTLKNTIEAATGRPVDGEILCPFFPEGGRFTFGNVHYLRQGSWLTPVGQTEFAGDKTFGYKASDLTEYVEEKTQGACPAAQCLTVSVEELRGGDVAALTQKLLKVSGYTRVVVNAVDYRDLEIFCAAFVGALNAGKQFLVRSAAAFPKVLGRVSDRPLLTCDDLADRAASSGCNGGMVLVGSHVQKTSDQLAALRGSSLPLTFLEFNVNTALCPGGLDNEVNRVVKAAEEAIRAGKTAVCYTSRRLLTPDTADKDEILRLSVDISAAVTSVVGRLNVRPRFIVAKGGITSSDVGTRALAVRCARVMGQVRKGVPVWMTGVESKFPGMPYVIFPGNVGETETLREIVEELAGGQHPGRRMTMRKVILSLAPVAAGTPVDAEKLALDVEKSVQAGAALCHLHCRLPDGSLTPDTTYLKQCFEAILARTDVVVQASTGGVSDMNIEERCRPLDYARVESASLNGGSTNLGEAIYRNSMADIRYCAKAVFQRHILPETEVFDIGMLHNMAVVEGEQPFAKPILYNLVFGHLGGMQPTPKALAAFRSFVPADALWGVTHYGRDNWTFLAAAIAMGATVVRIGFEDSDWLSEGERATQNWQIVEKAAALIRAMGLETATPAEARTILNLAPRT